jgi:hypothetical protein
MLHRRNSTIGTTWCTSVKLLNFGLSQAKGSARLYPLGGEANAGGLTEKSRKHILRYITAYPVEWHSGASTCMPEGHISNLIRRGASDREFAPDRQIDPWETQPHQFRDTQRKKGITYKRVFLEPVMNFASRIHAWKVPEKGVRGVESP